MLIDSRVPPQKIDYGFHGVDGKKRLVVCHDLYQGGQAYHCRARGVFAALYRAHAQAVVGHAPAFCDFGGQGRWRQDVLGFIAQTNPIYRKPPPME